MPAQTQRQQIPTWLLGLALFALTCVAYLPVLHAGFVWDDVYMVTDNRMLRDTQGLHNLWFTTKFADPYRVTMTLFWLEWQLWQNHPLGYHLVNVVTHALGVILFWRVLKKLSLPGAWVAAALFAVHPVGAASVAWVSEQKNTNSLVFYLLTMLAYFQFEQTGKKRWYAAALGAFICALLSKGSVVMLPVVLLLAAWWQRKKISRADLLRTLPLFVLSFGWGLVTIWFQKNRAMAGEDLSQGISFLNSFALAGRAVWFYLWKALVPLNLSVIYPHWQASGSILEFLPHVALIAVLVVCWMYRTTWGRHVLFGLGCTLVTLFPVLGFFNMYILIFSRTFDHWHYLALLSTVALVVCGATYWIRRLEPRLAWLSSGAPVLAGVLIAGLGAVTWVRAGVYTSEETLWSDTVKKNPAAWMAWNNFGNALGAAGKREEAIHAYNEALKINPDFPDAHSNLGNALMGKDLVDEANEHFVKAIKGESRVANFHFNYGIGLYRKGRFDEAIKEYQEAIRLNGAFADCRNNLSNLLLKQNRPKEALEQALIAIQIKPDSPEAHYNAGSAWSALGKSNEAMAEWQTAVKLRPTMAGVHYDMAIAFAMQNRMDDAAREFREVIQLKPDDASAHSSLGNALAAQKKLNEAIAEYEIALRLSPKDAQTHNNVANALAEQGKIAEAAAHYDTSIKLRADDPETHVNFAMLLARQGRLAEARTQYNEALRLKPGDPQIQRELQQLDAAQK